ncbi:hypothetical protein ACIHCQ_18455 [Streptomyces sp. NPDC052236]|uniref:hypothetical protein n=1 Tax=Streptomyces sp. NPDC052236 TaxID=3365686 RepID=UPI0037D1BE24
MNVLLLLGLPAGALAGYVLGAWPGAVIGAYCGATVGLLVQRGAENQRAARSLRIVVAQEFRADRSDPRAPALIAAIERGTTGYFIQGLGTLVGAVVGYLVPVTDTMAARGAFLGMAIGALAACFVGPRNALSAFAAAGRHLWVGAAALFSYERWGGNAFALAATITGAVLCWLLTAGTGSARTRTPF